MDDSFKVSICFPVWPPTSREGGVGVGGEGGGDRGGVEGTG